MEFFCYGADAFETSMRSFEKSEEFQRLDDSQRDAVRGVLAEWFEAALDDVIYRVYRFPYDAGLEPTEYFEIVKRRAGCSYKEKTYEYDVTYPDFILRARYVF